MTISEIQGLVERCKQIHGVNLNIFIEFNGRFTRRMGDARYFKLGCYGIVRLSSRLWNRATREQQENTVVHEVSHIIAHHITGCCQKHNSFWKAIHRKCGHTPYVYHTIDRTGLKRQVSRVKAYCGCGVHPITKHKRTKMLNGNQYRCLKCRQLLSLNRLVYGYSKTI